MQRDNLFSKIKNDLSYKLMPKGFAYVSISSLRDIQSLTSTLLNYEYKDFEEKDLIDYRFLAQNVTQWLKMKLIRKKKTLSEHLMGDSCFLVPEKDIKIVYNKIKDKKCADEKTCGQGYLCTTCLIKDKFSYYLGTAKR